MPILLFVVISVFILTNVIIHELMTKQINETKLVPHLSHWNRMRGPFEIYNLHRKLFPQSRLRNALVTMLWVQFIPVALLIVLVVSSAN
jgi:hypothetical protein